VRHSLRLLGWLGVSIVALVLEHSVVHRGVVVPAIESTGTVPPWAWVALIAPELVACFAAGWRLRAWRLVITYAALATAIRTAWYSLLAAAGEPGHGALRESALRTPLVGIAYLLVAGIASCSGKEIARIDEDARDG
jgi:hypothetical protein